MATRKHSSKARSTEVPSANVKHVLDREQEKSIRRALLIGLTCYGEIERLINAHGLYEICGKKVPEELCALHPTGGADVASQFAEALSYLEYSHEAEASHG